MPWTDSPPTEGPLLADRYRLVSRIGEGGMAGVYRAWDERLRVWRAAKVLLPEFARKKKLRARFEREAHTMARLEHPNLVRVVDVGSSGALPFIIMELVPCGTLMQWVERHGPMPEALAVDAMVQVGRGLAEVHRSGVIHRDIKPHNVLINEQGTCKITDFGIAQESAEGLTRAGSVMGTMGYMAPEQRNDAAGVDQRADVYGFGATLWKLVTGKPLRDLFMYTEDDEIMAGIDEGLAEVLMACLAYARQDRPEHMSEVIDALLAVRETLADPPASTPALPLAGQIEAVEASSDTFAEIGPAFTLSSDLSASNEVDEAPSLPPGGLGPPKSLPGLPYGLPQRMEAPPEAEDTGTPSWLVEDDPTTDEVGGGFEIRPDSAFLREDLGYDDSGPTTLYDAESQEAPVYTMDDATDEDEPKPAPEPVFVTSSAPSPVEEQEDAGPPVDLTLFFRLGVLGVLLVVFVLGGFLFWSRSVVAEAARASQAATQHFYATIDTERNVATELVHFDPNARVLEGLFLDYADQKGEPERWERAMTFVNEVEFYGAAAGRKPSAQARQVQGQVAVLTGARDQAVAKRRAWLTASGSFPGAVAAGIGLAPSPPFDAKALESK